MNEDNIYSNLDQLGKNSDIALSPQKAILERVPNPHKDTLYNVRFTCPEFTSLCPVTGQPDFAHIMIDYIPKEFLVESKSLKLFLNSYRNHQGFHEACTIEIAKRIIELLDPVWFRIGGYWYPRGGIPIDIFYQTDNAPENVWIPKQNVATYRGRG